MSDTTIHLRTDPEVERALADLGFHPGRRNKSKVVRAAILRAAAIAREDTLRAEIAEIAADPADRAHSLALLAEMEALD